MKVLCVEDDPACRQYLVDSVIAAGHEAVAAENGIIALKYYPVYRPDLVLCDIQMPKMNGLELLGTLRRQGEGVAVVMLTGDDCEEDAGEALRKGADDCLEKPVRFADLLPLLHKYTKRGDGRCTGHSRMNQWLPAIDSPFRQKRTEQTELLMHKDKMAALGLHSAGIVHEISNLMMPVVYNLSRLADGQGEFKKLMDRHRGIETVLRTPLSAEAGIQEIRNLLESSPLEDLRKEVLALLAEAVGGAMEVDALLKDLKAFSRLDNNRFAPADLNEHLDFALKMMQSRIRNRVVVNKQYGTLPLVNCAVHKIGQVFLNLLLNAEQAMGQKGTITITSRCTVPSKGTDATWVEVAFSDTGRGIARENLARVFEPFFTTKLAGEGTGLGLHIARAIIDGHGGTIDIDSIENVGTTVTVRLPAGVKNA